MYYLYDVDDYLDDFATTTTIKDIRDIAVSVGLRAFLGFLDNGYTTRMDLLVEEIDTIEWPEIDYIRATVGGLKNAALRAKEILIIHDGYE